MLVSSSHVVSTLVQEQLLASASQRMAAAWLRSAADPTLR